MLTRIKHFLRVCSLPACFLLTAAFVGGCLPEARHIIGPAPRVEPEPTASTPVTVAVPVGMKQPALADVQFLVVTDPVQALRAGDAAIAIVDGPPPKEELAAADDHSDGSVGSLDSFVFRAEEQILIQGWLDPPLALSREQAMTRLQGDRTAAGIGSKQPRPTRPAPGNLFWGRLADLKPGWAPVAVEGILPTPQSVFSGTYPLSDLVSVIHHRVLNSAQRAVLAALRQAALPPPGEWTRLTVVGDIMLARGVARAMREQGSLYPVARVGPYLSGADLTFANLESPIGVRGRPLPGKQIWFRAAPEAVDLLKAAGVDLVGIANNHILDYDTENFLETLDHLKKAGIGYVGGGRNIREARQPVVMESRGVRVAFLAYSQFADLFFDWNYPRSFAAAETMPGVPAIREDWLAADIKAAHSQADVVAIAYHWGEEFVNYPTDEQRRLAHLSIDLGADLVLGYHPHAIQGFELYKDGFIAYSTGNFIMDWQDTKLAQESMILDFQLAKDGVRTVAVKPVWIQAEQPYIMEGAAGEELMQKIRQISGWE